LKKRDEDAIMFEIDITIRIMVMFAMLFNGTDRFPVLETPRLHMRRMLPGDSRDMFEYAKNPDVTKYLLWECHSSEKYTRAYLNSVQRFYRKGCFFDWALIYKETGRMIGTCGFASLDEKNRCGEVGYVVNPAYRGCGIAAEAASRVIEYGFDELGLVRIQARFIAENTASRRVMEKCGMTFEGISRSAIFLKGRFVDIGTCAIINSAEFENYDNINGGI